MSHLLADEEQAIVGELALSMRGPRQNGLFVLWLLLRVCGDLFPPNALTERSHRRRLLSLEKRVRISTELTTQLLHIYTSGPAMILSTS